MGLFDKLQVKMNDMVQDAQQKTAERTERAQQRLSDYQKRIGIDTAPMPVSPEKPDFGTGPISPATDGVADAPTDLTPREQRQFDKKLRTIADLDREIAAKREQIITFDDAILMQEYGLYEPRFSFASSTQYKDKLKEVRDHQKQMIRDKTACSGDMTWTVNNSKAKGRKMVGDVQKLLMRSFNNECDEAVRKVKHSNIEASKKRIDKSAESIGRLGKTWAVQISPDYVALKHDELHLAFEFALAKEREKEELRELREREREEAKLRKEIEAQRKKLAKEQAQYERALQDARKQLVGCNESERAALEEKIAKLSSNLDEVERGIKDVDYREANQRAGYVYVISNIGSFGEDVYKIGMTRRLEPMDRVRELGDASVPFNFDVHALIFSDDAPKLEAALHNHFADRKVNLVNTRREFFRCTLDEIIEAVKANFDRTVEFQIVPDAEQFRTSQIMRGGTGEANPLK